MTEVFVVIRSDGEYSDRYETVLGYFADEESAQAFCTQAEREWKDASARFPEPKYPQGMILMRDDYDLVWPEKELSAHQGEFGTVRFVTPDYSVEPSKLPVPDEERARRAAIRADYHEAVSTCRGNRLSCVTLDRNGGPESSWYCERAAPLSLQPLSDSDTRPKAGDAKQGSTRE